MPNDDANDTAAEDKTQPPGLGWDSTTGALSMDGAIIGSTSFHDDGRKLITLNLGWLRLANVAFRLEHDPSVENRRGGVVLER
jgi:hypothetical protein